MEILNEYSGLFSLLAVVASVIVPFWIYRKQKKEQEKYYFMQKNDQEHFYNLQKKDQEHFYQKQQNDHLQDLRDEYEAIESTSMFSMSIADREFYGKKRFLEKKLRRK
nr:hypothetical protein [Prevotella sp.]